MRRVQDETRKRGLSLGEGLVMLHAMWILFAVLMLSPGLVFAAPCTRGVDCYCDKVKNPSHPFFDSSLLMCEDWEAPTLHDDVNFGGGPPNWGPPYDHTGTVAYRGFNSYFQRTYGGSGGAGWANGSPGAPLRGVTCNAGGQGCLLSSAHWRSDNLWQANSAANSGTTAAGNVIYRNGEFQNELNVSDPTFPGGSGVFDGNQGFAHRVCAGNVGGAACLSGIKGASFFPGGAKRTFGITMAVAYASNSNASGVWNNPWKHNEWGVGLNDGIFLFHNSDGVNSKIPFEMFMFGTADAAFQAKIAAATKTAAIFIANGNYFAYQADASYTQAIHWPNGTWGCVRGYFQNLGLTNASIQIFLTTAATGIEMKIIDISNLDLTSMNHAAPGGYDAFVWNAYANANQGTPGAVPSTQTTFRYEDNIHIRAGQPVSCAQIGFRASSSPPVGPTGLLVSP